MLKSGLYFILALYNPDSFPIVIWLLFFIFLFYICISPHTRLLTGL